MQYLIFQQCEQCRQFRKHINLEPLYYYSLSSVQAAYKTKNLFKLSTSKKNKSNTQNG